MFKINRNKEGEQRPPAGPFSMPLLPLRDIVVFPSMVVPLFVGRDKSVNALEQASSIDKQIFLAAFANVSAVVQRLIGRDEVHILCAGTDGELTEDDTLLASFPQNT